MGSIVIIAMWLIVGSVWVEFCFSFFLQKFQFLLSIAQLKLVKLMKNLLFEERHSRRNLHVRITNVANKNFQTPAIQFHARKCGEINKLATEYGAFSIYLFFASASSVCSYNLRLFKSTSYPMLCPAKWNDLNSLYFLFVVTIALSILNCWTWAILQSHRLLSWLRDISFARHNKNGPRQFNNSKTLLFTIK